MKRIPGAWLLVLIGFAAEGQAETVIPFSLAGRHLIVVKGSIGRLENLNLVVDTGASSTVISRSVAKALGLKRLCLDFEKGLMSWER